MKQIKKCDLVALIKKGAFNHTHKIMPINDRNLDGDLIRPFKHQVAAFLMGVTLDNCAFLMEQGTGKTLPMIAVLGHRYLQGQIKRALIVCPVSVASELELQFKNFANYRHRVTVLVGDKKLRDYTLANWVDSPGLEIVITNYEAVWSRLKNGRNGNDPAITKWKPDMIVCDESQKLKNGNSTQTRALCKIAKSSSIYRMIMTGTPVSEGPLDFFGQYKFLDPCIFGTSFTKFKDEYALMGGYRGYQVIGYKNEHKLARKAHSISYRASKLECLDLPAVTEQTLSVTLEPKAQAIYKELYKESIIELEGQVITTPLIITRNMKLAQIAGGYLKTDEGIIKISNAKMLATIDKIQDIVEAGSKIVVFAKFIAEIDGICSELRKLKIKHSRLSGSTKIPDRKGIIADFQNPKSKTKVIVIQTATGGVGITLTQADTEIFYSRDFSNIQYEQAKARVDRIGQKKKVTIIHVVAKGTIDVKVAKALIKKQDVSKMLIDDFYNKNIKRGIKMRYKQEPLEIVFPIREIKLHMPEQQELVIEQVPLIGTTVVSAEATKDDLESLLIQMEKELSVAPPDKLNLWDDKPDTPVRASKQKRDKTPTKPKQIELNPKQERTIVKLTGDIIPLKQLAESMNAEPKHIRVWLRKQGITTKSGKWEWEANDPQLDEIQKGFPG